MYIKRSRNINTLALTSDIKHWDYDIETAYSKVNQAIPCMLLNATTLG